MPQLYSILQNVVIAPPGLSTQYVVQYVHKKSYIVVHSTADLLKH